MTFTCSLRSLAATALAASLVLPMAASAAGPGPGRGHPTPTPGSTPTPGGSRHPSISRHQVSGILKEMTGTTVPAALTVQARSTTVIVTVPATTTVVRSYGGRASLDEFASGDRISAQGSFATGSTTTFIARRIQDWSVQARSRVVGSILSVDLPNSLTLQVARGGSPHSRYQRSQPVTVTLTSSTLIVSGSVTMAVGDLHQGMRVLAMGVYNRTQSTLRATRVRILSARRRGPVAVPTP